MLIAQALLCSHSGDKKIFRTFAKIVAFSIAALPFTGCGAGNSHTLPSVSSQQYSNLALTSGKHVLTAAVNAWTPSIPPDRSYLSQSAWLALHKGFVQQVAAGGINLLFIGDSITYYWPINGVNVWDSTYLPKQAAAFGIPGDETEWLLWRIKNGELSGITPKVVVILIGTNNIVNSGKSLADTAHGVQAVVSAVRSASPNSKIILMGILPRNDNAAVEAQIPAVNALIAGDASGNVVNYLDIASSLTLNGALIGTDFIDGLHPTEQGYQAWATAMNPLLTSLW